MPITCEICGLTDPEYASCKCYTKELTENLKLIKGSTILNVQYLCNSQGCGVFYELRLPDDPSEAEHKINRDITLYMSTTDAYSSAHPYRKLYAMTKEEFNVLKHFEDIRSGDVSKLDELSVYDMFFFFTAFI